jgi:hypothetical protein
MESNGQARGGDERERGGGGGSLAALRIGDAVCIHACLNPQGLAGELPHTLVERTLRGAPNRF